jgi:hypothetical protein
VRPSGEKLKTLQITRSKMDKRLKVSLEFTVGESSLDFACLFDAPPPLQPYWAITWFLCVCECEAAGQI